MKGGISVVGKSKEPRRNPATEDREKKKHGLRRDQGQEKGKNDSIGTKMKYSEEIKKDRTLRRSACWATLQQSTRDAGESRATLRDETLLR